MTRDRFPELYCSECEKLIGEVSLDELEAAFAADNEQFLCFDCDASENSENRQFFVNAEVGELICVDGLEFWVNRNVNGELRWRSNSRVLIYNNSSLSLSSSTKVNTAPNPDGQEPVFFDVLKTMPSMEQLLALTLPFASDCEDCVKIGLLPGRELGNDKHWYCPKHRVERVNFGAIRCRDCWDEVDKGGSYCSYHHALLVEQHEDGSLGWDNA